MDPELFITDYSDPELIQQALRDVRESIVDDTDLDQVVMRILTCDGDMFKIDPRVTQASKFLRAKLNDVGREDEIELEGVHTLIFLKALAFMKAHDDDRPMPIIELPIKSSNLSKCGLNFWHERYMKIDTQMLLDLLAAADLLIMRSLHHLIIAKLAARLYEGAELCERSPQKVDLSMQALFLLLSEGIPYLESRERCNAMLLLCRILPPDLDAKSRTEAVRLVGKRLGDRDETVRGTALEALPHVSVQGSDESFFAVAEWLEDKDAGVRCFAIKAFAIVADKGAERSVSRIVRCLRASSEVARKTALPVLFKVCHDAAQGIHFIGESLEHEMETVRNYAAETLLEFVKGEHREIVLNVVHARLTHMNSTVRSLALETFSHMYPNEDENVNCLIREMLVDPIAKVRQAAVDALGRRTGKNCPENLEICGKLLAHEDTGICQTALQLFLTCAEPGSEAQYQMILPLMCHENSDVRQIAGLALHKTLGKGKKEDVASLVFRLEHQIKKIREAVTEVLARVAEKGTDQGVGADAADRPRVEHPGYGLLAEAANTFALIANENSRHALAILSEDVEYNDDATRNAIITALMEVGDFGRERILKAVCILMEDQIQRVLHRMTKAFSEVAESGRFPALIAMVASGDDINNNCSDRLFEAVVHGLEHYDLRIRRAAAAQAVSLFQMSGVENGIAELLSIVKAQIMRVREAMVDALANQLEKGSEQLIFLVTERLDDEDAGIRIAAIRNMSRIVAHMNCACGVREVSRRLENPRAEIRADAVKALLEIITVGHTRPIQAVMSRLEHSDANVRKIAVEALPQIAGLDSEFTIAATCALLDHSYPYVREAAVECLDIVVTKGNELAIKTVAPFLDHEDKEIRDLAVIALTKVSYINDICAATEVLQRIEAKEEHIVITAIGALPYVLEKDDQTAVAWVIECLADVSQDVREAAHEVLTQVASIGNLAAITGIGGYFGHKSKKVQKLAAVCIFEVTYVGSEAAISSVCVHLSRSDDEVRHRVVENLQRIAGKGNPHAFQEVAVHLESKDKRVLISALQALVEICEVGDEKAIAEVGKFLEHTSPDVRTQAGHCFEILTPKDSQQALEILLPRFAYKNLKVVVTALDALGRISTRGNQQAWEIANRFLSPPHDKGLVRKAAVIAMGRVAVINNDENSELVLISRLGDLDPEVKETAQEWLDIYRGKKQPPSTLPGGKKPTFRGTVSAAMASRRMSSALGRSG